MCLIIDTNRIGTFLASPPHPDTLPIHRWLTKQGGMIVYSVAGEFGEELSSTAKSRLFALSQAGRARLVPAGRVTDELERLQQSPELQSDDPHVLALARASGTRLLYTGDRKLMDDFRDKRIIDNPRGKIYSGQQNHRLLTATTCTAK